MLYLLYVPYLVMVYVICVTGMQFMLTMYTDKHAVSHLEKTPASRYFITEYSSTVYIGIAMVYPH